jgi:hypothetical protein
MIVTSVGALLGAGGGVYAGLSEHSGTSHYQLVTSVGITAGFFIGRGVDVLWRGWRSGWRP